MTKTPRWIAVAAAAAAAATLTPVHAHDSGNWLVRAKLTHLDPVNRDNVPTLDLSINARTFPTIDIVHFLTPNIAAELILTVPQRHDIRHAATRIGSVRHLPPTLSLQYHFTGLQGFRPYVGVGVNYTRFSDVDLPHGITLRRDSVGLALGAGVDVPLGGGWLIGADVKKVQIDTTLRDAAGARMGTFDINPWLFSVGVGRRF